MSERVWFLFAERGPVEDGKAQTWRASTIGQFPLVPLGSIPQRGDGFRVPGLRVGILGQRLSLSLFDESETHIPLLEASEPRFQRIHPGLENNLSVREIRVPGQTRHAQTAQENHPISRSRLRLFRLLLPQE